MATIAGELSNPFTANIGYTDALSASSFNRGIAYVDPFGSMGTFQRTVLIGQGASTIVNSAFWTLTPASGGTLVNQSGLFHFQTSANPAGSMTCRSRQRAILQMGQLNQASIAMQFPDGVVPPVNTTVQLGIYDGTDGVFLEWLNGALGIVVSIGGVRTRTEQAAFNGDPFVYDFTVPNLWTFLYAPGGGQLYLGRLLVHTFFGSTGDNQNFPLWARVANTGSTANLQMLINGWAMQRMGGAEIEPTYAHFSSAATLTLKTGAGTLERVLVTKRGSNNATLTLYDNTAASGVVMAVIDVSELGSYEFDCDFATGLTAVCTNAPDVTVIYQ